MNDTTVWSLSLSLPPSPLGPTFHQQTLIVCLLCSRPKLGSGNTRWKFTDFWPQWFTAEWQSEMFRHYSPAPKMPCLRYHGTWKCRGRKGYLVLGSGHHSLWVVSAWCLFLYDAQGKYVFKISCFWKIIIWRIVFQGTWKLYEFKTSVSITKVLQEGSQALLFTCCLRLLSHYKGRAE